MVVESSESEFRELTERVILTLTLSKAASSVSFIGTSTPAADLSSKDSKMDFLLSIYMTNTVNIKSCIPTSELEVKTNSKYRSNSSKSNYNHIIASIDYVIFNPNLFNPNYQTQIFMG